MMENKKITAEKQKKRYYLAYGSNLNVQQMRLRCPGATILGTATLKGWELLFKGSQTGAYLTVEKKEGGRVPVALWEVTPEDEEKLDRYEGYPRFYYKKELKVRYRGILSGKIRTVTAFIYIMHEERKIGIPSELYMDICREGYDTFYFDRRILEDAKERSVRLFEEENDRRHKEFWKGFTLIGGK